MLTIRGASKVSQVEGTVCTQNGCRSLQGMYRHSRRMLPGGLSHGERHRVRLTRKDRVQESTAAGCCVCPWTGWHWGIIESCWARKWHGTDQIGDYCKRSGQHMTTQFFSWKNITPMGIIHYLLHSSLSNAVTHVRLGFVEVAES